ncbi:MAG: hypothetical protein JW864_08295 [Spirochaetes bacterium]|nr:hypothetical protein [Spirochaetota bacterium]
MNKQIQRDSSLIVPGVGAESVIVNGDAKTVISLKGYPDKVSEVNEKKELFYDIFKIKSPVNIFFDKIYYYNYYKTVFFIDSNVITAIAGMNTDRVTTESVSLVRGVEYFIFNYGNENLYTLKRENASDFIYLYSKYGIALIDDKGDDSIDMFIVFPGQNK